jgi:uncharacterized FAD-dependent dehydrogenase
LLPITSANIPRCGFLLIEKGKPPFKRTCPMGDRGCIHCRPCNILCGIGGAGLFSDGKLNFIPKLGKTDLTQFLGISEAGKLIDETEAIFNRFGMDGQVYPTDMETARIIRKEAGKTASTCCSSGKNTWAATISPGTLMPWPGTLPTRA